MKMDENIFEAVQYICDTLRTNDFADCCEVSGQTEGKIGSYVVNGVPLILSEYSYLRLVYENYLAAQKNKNQPEYIVGGIIGAILGSTIGAVSALFSYF